MTTRKILAPYTFPSTGTNIPNRTVLAAMTNKQSHADLTHPPAHKKKRTQPGRAESSLVVGSGGRIRTYDLRVMSPTSCLTAPPRDKEEHSARAALGVKSDAQEPQKSPPQTPPFLQLPQLRQLRQLPS
jgi:hypothetical protein